MYLVECKPDSILVEYLASASRRSIRHTGGKFELLKILADRETGAKGLIDEDPGSYEPPHLERFRVRYNLTNHGFKVLHYESRNNVLIVLCPRLEEWVLKAAKEANVDVRAYGLPIDASELHEWINIRIKGFERLVEDLKGKSSAVKSLERYLRNDT